MQGTLVALALVIVLSDAAIAQECREVAAEDVYDAMLSEYEKGYDIRATTNGSRVLANVNLQIARWARERNPDGSPICISQEDYFNAFLRLSGLEPSEAPAFVRLANEYSQNLMIEYRRDHVLDTTRTEDAPLVALSVKTWWSDSLDLPSTYSYRDTLSNPTLLVINERVIRYRLLDYGDMIVYDEVEGLRGRPTSGFLGFIFRILGAGHVEWSRSALSEDGLQVVYGRAAKGFMGRSATVTVYPDGNAENGIPDDREDLRAIEERLKEAPDVVYRDFTF